ncbi:carotenoid biosynthesis protein [Xanthomonas sp. NCPPB 3443]|uniref:carotenoid biosynthesis protein n=1 Tax=Xanthomonas sp. NCPPB 3443 TaxID=3243407 RepID=UPI003556ADA5
MSSSTYAGEQRVSKARLSLLYAPIVLFAVIYPLFLKTPTISGIVIILFGTSFAFLHGVPRYGWKGMLIFVALSLGISFALENLSVLTGFPFGHYHYTNTGPRVFNVPIIVGPIYFSMGYLSWSVANAALSLADTRLSSTREILALPIAAAFAMVQWDVVMDPLQSTYAHEWIWHNGGGYFGVPLANYLGWFVTVWLFYQAFALYLRRTGKSAPAFTSERSYLVAPILFYLVFALTWAFPYFTFADEVLTDQSGTAWSLDDVSESAVIVLLYTVVPTGLMALYRALQVRSSHG